MPSPAIWSKIQPEKGDITLRAVDAIVNAANSGLRGGGGVDGAIHRAAGPQLLDACRKLGGCETGDAKITPGFKLPAKFVIHAVGPVYHDGQHGEPRLLASCYRRSLQIAARQGLKTIAFPAISTGIYAYPFDDATRIAIQTTADFLNENDTIQRVTFVFFSDADHTRAMAIYRELAGATL
jgi:O-acetyl-ADP-ribose deacetylase